MGGRVKRCVVCQVRPPTRKGRCMTCYQFLRRNGYDRPEGLVVRAACYGRSGPRDHDGGPLIAWWNRVPASLFSRCTRRL